ncbi:MAG: energy-coupling factor transporter transmembrane protein EcfT [Vulcanimicrobiota bacterium]
MIATFSPRASRPWQLDPRALMLSALLAIAAITWTESWAGLGLTALALTLLALLWGVPLLAWWLRSALVLPFCLAALPLVFTDPGPAWIQVMGLTASHTGVEHFLSIVVHCWLCLQALLLAMAVGGPTQLVEALGGLGMPARLLMVVRLCVRYLDLLKQEAARMARARQCRSCGPGRPGLGFRLAVVGQQVGSLFLRALDRAQRVHLAMRCRGYSSADPMFAVEFRPWRGADFALVGLSLGWLGTAVWPG